MRDVFEFPGGLTSSIVLYLALNDKQTLHLFHGNKQTKPKQINRKKRKPQILNSYRHFGGGEKRIWEYILGNICILILLGDNML